MILAGHEATEEPVCTQAVPPELESYHRRPCPVDRAQAAQVGPLRACLDQERGHHQFVRRVGDVLFIGVDIKVLNMLKLNLTNRFDM